MAELIVKDVALRLGDNEILKGVSLAVPAGEVVALLGPSGSGKTTLLRAIAGLETPHDGSIAIGDNVFFGGLSAVHQFARIGEGVMIAGLTGVPGDIIPFGYARGSYATLVGINVVGMRRKGYSRDDMHRLRRANNELFADTGTFSERLESVAKKYAGDAVVGKVITFIQQGSSRALVQPARGGDADANSGPT